MSRVFTITIPAPHEWINANKREHWRKKAEKTCEWRAAGCRHAALAKLPTLGRAHILAELHFPDRRSRDAHNYFPTLKAIVDGLVDAGLMADDSTKYLDGPDLRIGSPLPKGPKSYAPAGQVVLTITELAVS